MKETTKQRRERVEERIQKKEEETFREMAANSAKDFNIDTPIGIPFTVNKTISVDCHGRISLRYKSALRAKRLGGKNSPIVLSAKTAQFDLYLEMPISECKALAYQILGMVAENEPKITLET